MIFAARLRAFPFHSANAAFHDIFARVSQKSNFGDFLDDKAPYLFSLFVIYLFIYLFIHLFIHFSFFFILFLSFCYSCWPSYGLALSSKTFKKVSSKRKLWPWSSLGWLRENFLLPFNHTLVFSKLKLTITLIILALERSLPPSDRGDDV